MKFSQRFLAKNCLPLFSGLLILIGALGRSRAEDWPQFRGPRGDGTWNGPKLALTWPADGPKIAWRRPVGGGYAGVVAVAGRVYTMDRQTAPHEVERVLAFDATSGEQLWSHEYPVAYGKLDYGTGPREGVVAKLCQRRKVYGNFGLVGL